ncbi:LBP_cg2779 family protein [Companilactobacillus furfuricola]|uniref:LBP_cg2779 family protein n=1 Tax=Companilactobacillus furfuricola TaxID=1462575 RepID=UPI000F7A379B|nr:LBP_cg2779 family protein [Companilactobacillus furfuricola]
MDKPNISEMIIEYEKNKNMNDTQFAFESHLSVERVHNLKSGGYEATPDEEKVILEYIKLHS